MPQPGYKMQLCNCASRRPRPMVIAMVMSHAAAWWQPQRPHATRQHADAPLPPLTPPGHKTLPCSATHTHSQHASTWLHRAMTPTHACASLNNPHVLCRQVALRCNARTHTLPQDGAAARQHCLPLSLSASCAPNQPPLLLQARQQSPVAPLPPILDPSAAPSPPPHYHTHRLRDIP